MRGGQDNRTVRALFMGLAQEMRRWLTCAIRELNLPPMGSCSRQFEFGRGSGRSLSPPPPISRTMPANLLTCSIRELAAFSMWLNRRGARLKIR